MKETTPAANIAIGTLYLISLGLIIIVTKMSTKQPVQQTQNAQNANKKQFNANNINKALSSPKYVQQIPLKMTIFKSIFKKYWFAGTFVNTDKLYLLKQICILTMICVACTWINSIELWPLAIIVPFLILSFVVFEIALTRKWGGNRVHEADVNYNMQVIENQRVTQPHHVKQQLLDSNSKNRVREMKYVICSSIISFTSLVLLSQTMMTLYNSMSNSGVLNLASVAAILAIDQLAIRPFATGITILILFINEKFGQKSVFQYSFMTKFCKSQLVKILNQLYEKHGQQYFQMGASPTKKKTISPSKIPKANALVYQSQTLMNLQSTNRQNHDETNESLTKNQQIKPIEQIRQENSPIKQIQISKNNSYLLTSIQKNMFGENVNTQNQLQDFQSVQQNNKKKTLNPNQYFSNQRLPKNNKDSEDVQIDGFFLIQTGLNGFQSKDQQQYKSNTLDVQFSPNKRNKKLNYKNKNKRQLIITGSSPYLEYLPDMMKKVDKKGQPQQLQQPRKSTTPSHINQSIPYVPRKVL